MSSGGEDLVVHPYMCSSGASARTWAGRETTDKRTARCDSKGAVCGPFCQQMAVVPGGATVALVARRNNRNRYFVTSLESTFGGYPQRAVMLDSGCNSALLALDETDVQGFLDRFPAEVFHFDFALGGGIAAVPTLTLRVRRADNGVIAAAVAGHPLHLAALRFHVSLAACRALLTARPELQSAMVAEWMALVTLPGVQAPPARTCALLGQALMGRAGFVTVQCEEFMVLLNVTGATYDHVSLLQWLHEHAPALPDDCRDLEDDHVELAASWHTPPRVKFAYIDDGA